jgi:hypothetical protein
VTKHKNDQRLKEKQSESRMEADNPATHNRFQSFEKATEFVVCLLFFVISSHLFVSLAQDNEQNVQPQEKNRRKAKGGF